MWCEECCEAGMCYVVVHKKERKVAHMCNESLADPKNSTYQSMYVSATQLHARVARMVLQPLPSEWQPLLAALVALFRTAHGMHG